MAQAVRAAIRDPGQCVRNHALAIVQGLPSRDFRGELTAVYDWFTGHVRFVRDPEGLETLATPCRTLNILTGDCDDQATAIAALLTALGFPTRFVAVGFAPGQYSHVFAETRLGNQWIPVETTVDAAYIGWYPPGVQSRMVQNVHNSKGA
jgi:transglutaminase-like putative cysteine protease